MSATVNFVRAETIGRPFTIDPDLKLPVRPRLIPELIVCLFEKDGVLFAGSQSMEVLRGRSARQLLPRLLPLLDGTRSKEELRAMLPDLSAEALSNVLSLLFSRGVLEDGAPDGTQRPGLSETEAFLGRYNDVSRRNRNRGEAIAHLVASSIQVCGPEIHAQFVMEQLADSGVRDICRGGQRAGGYDLTIAISTGGEPLTVQTLEAYLSSSQSVLVVRLGEREAQLGPQLIRRLTVCPACLIAMHPHPAGSPSPLLAQVWLSLAAQSAIIYLSRVGPSIRTRSFYQVRMDAEGRMIQRAKLTPRVPGCRGCGIDGELWRSDDPRLLAWLYHEGTSASRRRDLAPKDHQAHYLASNLKLSASPGVVLHSSSTFRLPPPQQLHVPVPWAGEPAPALVSRLSTCALSIFLARVAGETRDGTGWHRTAPTGGNLGSVRLWVLVRDVDGLAKGAYLYDPREHALALRGRFDDSDLSEALGTTAELPPCVVLGAGDLAKCAKKYQSFAYRLIHLDAGVAIAFAHTVAQGLGLRLREYADFDVRLPTIFGVPRRWEIPLPTFALGIYAVSLPAEERPDNRTPPPQAPLTPDDYSADAFPQRLAYAPERPFPIQWQHSRSVRMPAVAKPSVAVLEDLLLSRRAVRLYSSTPPAHETLREIMTIAEAVSEMRDAAGAAPSFVRTVLLVPHPLTNLAAGVYEFAPGQPVPMVRRSGFDPNGAGDCINQLGLARSPVSLVAVADLRRALTRRMSRGYSEVAIAAGAAIGTAWQAACSYGLVGTAAGGVIAHGLREAAAMDGFNECPMLALHLGLPKPA
jgi:SagB-type dehydrogenase family enzyme